MHAPFVNLAKLHLLIQGHQRRGPSLVTVFVSYSSRDRDPVKSLTQDLQDAEEQVWMDQRLAVAELCRRQAHGSLVSVAESRKAWPT